MLFTENVIPYLSQSLQHGVDIALVTLVNIEGSSPRPPGSQLGVCADGSHSGMITGGCAEKAIIAEAVNCIQARQNKLVRYGEGSPYLDVVLPCGSGIDIHIETTKCPTIIPDVMAAQEARQSISVTFDLENTQKFTKTWHPEYQVYVFGEGTNLISFATLATTAGFDIHAFTPDQESLEHLKNLEITATSITHATDFNQLAIDSFTALVTLFHEHEWEQAILQAALKSDADYIGALGSRRTHEARLDLLSAQMSAAQEKSSSGSSQPLDVIHGPIGLNIGAKNPNEIAVSILAQIIEHRHRTAPSLV